MVLILQNIQLKVFCPLHSCDMTTGCYYKRLSDRVLILPIGCDKTVFCNPLCIACFKTCYYAVEQRLADLATAPPDEKHPSWPFPAETPTVRSFWRFPFSLVPPARQSPLRFHFFCAAVKVVPHRVESMTAFAYNGIKAKLMEAFRELSPQQYCKNVFHNWHFSL